MKETTVFGIRVWPGKPACYGSYDGLISCDGGGRLCRYCDYRHNCKSVTMQDPENAKFATRMIDVQIQNTEDEN
jgi:hypothetical protein